MNLTALPASTPSRLRAAGLNVVEVPGWLSRRRPGAFGPVGVLWHHTGGDGDGLKYARWLALTGRSDLPAPLCQLSIGRDGTVYVLAAGRANHAGRAKASGTVSAGDGNALYVGVECHNDGDEGWSTEQYDAMVAVGVVLAGILGTSAQTQRAHRETSVTGKWDPGKLDMDEFRADVALGMVGRKKTAVPPSLRNWVANDERLLREVKALKAAGRPYRGHEKQLAAVRETLRGGHWTRDQWKALLSEQAAGLRAAAARPWERKTLAAWVRIVAHGRHLFHNVIKP